MGSAGSFASCSYHNRQGGHQNASSPVCTTSCMNCCRAGWGTAVFDPWSRQHDLLGVEHFFYAVMKFVLELAALLRSVIYVFGAENLSQQVICASESSANFGDLITADHKVLSDNCASPNNHCYAVVVQDLDSMDPVISVQNKKLLRKFKEACKSSWGPTGSLKSFTLTIPWNSENLVKISPGIIARLHHTDQKQMGLLKEQWAE